MYTSKKLHGRRIPQVRVGVGVGPMEFQLYQTCIIGQVGGQVGEDVRVGVVVGVGPMEFKLIRQKFVVDWVVSV